MSRLVEWALGRPRAVLVGALLLLAALAPGALRLTSDNSPPVWFVDGAPELASYRRFVAEFGPDDGFRILLEGGELWSAEGIGYLERVEREARTLPGVRATSSLLDRHRLELSEPPPEAGEELRALGLASRFDRAMGWIADEGRLVSVLVETDALSRQRLAALRGGLHELVASPPPGVRASVLGTRSLERALDRSSEEIGRVFFPALILFAVLLLAATFRDAAGVLVPLALVALAEGATLGAMGWAGVRLDLVLAILPPLVYAIVLATAIHVLIPCRAAEAAGAAPADAVRAVYRDKGRALVAAGISTAMGFAALALSPVPAVRALGLWSAAGLALQTLAAFVVLPALLALTAARRGLPERALEARLERLGGSLARFAHRRRVAVLGVFALLSVVAAAGLFRLERASNALGYLPAEDPTRVAIERSERLGIGLATIELRIEAGAGDAGIWRTPRGLAALARLERELGGVPGVLGAVGPGGLAEELGAASPFAELQSEEENLAAGLELAASEPEARAGFDRFVAADGTLARLTLFVPHSGYAEIDRLSTAALDRAREELPTGTMIEATGLLRVLLALHRSLLATLGRSLALTAAVAAAVFAWLLGRVRDVVRALVPNLGPILLLLGGMGWLGVRLDVATAMVASILLGLVVDDTIHTLARYRDRRERAGAFTAVAEKLERTTPAYLLTGAILAAGFGVCALSGFAPIARFGGLAAAGVVLAVAADLILVPALFSRE